MSPYPFLLSRQKSNEVTMKVKELDTSLLEGLKKSVTILNYLLIGRHSDGEVMKADHLPGVSVR